MKTLLKVNFIFSYQAFLLSEFISYTFSVHVGHTNSLDVLEYVKPISTSDHYNVFFYLHSG